jgi:hypothetical protein
MAMIKDALSALPAKPALIIAPLLVVLVLSLYYRDQYNRCVEIKQSRAALNEHLRAVPVDEPFRLADFTDFTWNKVRIVTQVEPGTISEVCPFDWNWAGGERESLIDAGLLTAVIFGLEGKVVGYLELRADEVEFRAAEGNLTPESAVFRVESNPSNGNAVALKQVQ